MHGGDCVNHAVKFWLYSCICLCGLVSGPTRKAIRDEHNLPVEPDCLKDQGVNADCITGTIPCIACFALCQDNRELTARNHPAPFNPIEFSFAPVPVTAAPAATSAPAAEAMSK